MPPGGMLAENWHASQCPVAGFRWACFAGADLAGSAFRHLAPGSAKNKKGKNSFFPFSSRGDQPYFLPPFLAPPAGFSVDFSAGFEAVFGLLSAFFFIVLPPG
jgi:hypothetical protein